MNAKSYITLMSVLLTENDLLDQQVYKTQLLLLKELMGFSGDLWHFN